MTPLKQQISTDASFNKKKVIILLQQSTFRRFSAKYYHLFIETGTTDRRSPLRHGPTNSVGLQVLFYVILYGKKLLLCRYSSSGLKSMDRFTRRRSAPLVPLSFLTWTSTIRSSLSMDAIRTVWKWFQLHTTAPSAA